MNVLILTPDAVGSTLLQRLLTIYMQFHRFDRPVINLHELTNGINSYYSSDFNREIIGRTHVGYTQSLTEITDILKSIDHYKVARVAQYHIKARKDVIEQQVPFYRYLDDNFFVISARRKNVFEQAISWGITKITKKLNVYSPHEKIDTFINLYKSSVELDETSFITSLETYKNYLQWCEDHFAIGSYFYYDEHVQNIEKYILNLPVFAGQSKKVSWNDVYGIDFADWNRCHYFSSNIESIALENTSSALQIDFDKSKLDFLSTYFDQTLAKDYNNISDPSWPKVNSIADFEMLPESIKNECVDLHNVQAYNRYLNLKTVVAKLPIGQIDFLQQNFKKYADAYQSINQMQTLGIVPSNLPIKKQTLATKKAMIKNFDRCVDLYNEWILKNPEVGQPIDSTKLLAQADQEKRQWQVNHTTTLLT